MNKAEKLRNKLGLSKREAGIHILKIENPQYAGVQWGRIEAQKDNTTGMSALIDVYIQISDRANTNGAFKGLLADLLYKRGE